jgi:peptide/nickel transport system permease protein
MASTALKTGAKTGATRPTVRILVKSWVLRRFASVIPTLFGMSVLIFLMVRLLPGNAVDVLATGGGGVGSTESRAQIRALLGLNHSIPVQYVLWIGGMFRGNFGVSFFTGTPVSAILASALPITLELTLIAVILATALGIPLGVLSAKKQNTPTDFALRSVSLLGLAVPDFWLATVLLLLTSTVFHWTPAPVWVPLVQNPVENLTQAALPSGILALFMLSSAMRLTRTTMLEVLRQDYIRTARAKGIQPRRILRHHALRNALIPVVSLTGAQVAALVSGATILETIFGYPGVGYTLTHAIYNRDYPVIQDSALVLAVIMVLLSLVVDLSYTLLDPRVRRG